MRLGHVDFLLRVLFVASVGLLALVTFRPYSTDSSNNNNNNFLLFEANINNNNDVASSSLLVTRQRQKKQAKQSLQNGVAKDGNDSEALLELLVKSMRILCICQTTAPRHKERAIHVKATWGKRCTKLIFASDDDDPELPAYRFSQWAGREYVSYKMRTALQWAYDHELNNFDWFLKADDDSFIMMENLRAFLSNFKPDDDHYFGRHFSVAKSVIGESFVSGAAYALSRSTLRRLVEEAFPNVDKCPQPAPDAHEDVNLGYCLKQIGISPGESRDHLGRHRFLVFSPWVHLTAGMADRNNWIRRYDKFEYIEGEGCCSDTAILLHYVPSGYMLAMEYLLYRLRPVGIENWRNILPCYSNNSNIESLKEALILRGYKITKNNNNSAGPKNDVDNNKRFITDRTLKSKFFLQPSSTDEGDQTITTAAIITMAPTM